MFFVICLILMSITKKVATTVEMKAEFIVVLTWNSNENGEADDIDLWVEDPVGNVIFFRRKEIGLMHLDRDDLGATNDVIITADGRKIMSTTNQEIATIRGLINGEWTVNLHMYKKKVKMISDVEVRIEKLNPSVSTIAHEKYRMSQDLEEITVIRFTTSEDGTVLLTDKTPKELVKRELLSTHRDFYMGER